MSATGFGTVGLAAGISTSPSLSTRALSLAEWRAASVRRLRYSMSRLVVGGFVLAIWLGKGRASRVAIVAAWCALCGDVGAQMSAEYNNTRSTEHMARTDTLDLDTYSIK